MENRGTNGLFGAFFAIILVIVIIGFLLSYMRTKRESRDEEGDYKEGRADSSGTVKTISGPVTTALGGTQVSLGPTVSHSKLSVSSGDLVSQQLSGPLAKAFCRSAAHNNWFNVRQLTSDEISSCKQKLGTT